MIAYVICAVVCALVAMTVSSYYYFEGCPNPDGGEKVILAVIYFICCTLSLIWPVVIGIALVVGLFFGLIEFMKKLTTTLRRKINARA